VIRSNHSISSALLRPSARQPLQAGSKDSRKRQAGQGVLMCAMPAVIVPAPAHCLESARAWR